MKPTHHKDINKKFGKLTILETWTDKEKKRAFCKCVCDCKNIIEYTRLDAIKSFKMVSCKSCSKRGMAKKNFGCGNPSWKGVGKIGRSFYNTYKYGAKKRNIEFSVSHEYISELFDKQNQKCALSGILLIVGKFRGAGTTASLDRIDSSKGYIEGNVQWIHKDVNFIKREYDQEYFLDLCFKISDNLRK